MRAPYELRRRWRAAKKLRRAKRKVERALWYRDDGYGMGKRFHPSDSGAGMDGLYDRASEVMGILETEARLLEGKCS